MPLNDPQSSTRSRSGFRDLSEIWRDVSRRWSKDARDSDASAARPRQLMLCAAGLLAALLLAWLASGFYIVDEGRRGVVTRFGRYTETTRPGLRWHLPFPIEFAEVIAFSQVRTVEIGYRNSNPRNKVAQELSMLTDDENIIDIQFAVQYNVTSATEYVFNTQIGRASCRELV